MNNITGESVVRKMGTGGYGSQGRGHVDLSPVTAKLKEVYGMVNYYQNRTPNTLDMRHLLVKLQEAAAIGAKLKAKADSGKF